MANMQKLGFTELERWWISGELEKHLRIMIQPQYVDQFIIRLLKNIKHPGSVAVE